MNLLLMQISKIPPRLVISKRVYFKEWEKFAYMKSEVINMTLGKDNKYRKQTANLHIFPVSGLLRSK